MKYLRHFQGVVLIVRILDTYDYDECIAIQHVFNKLEGEMTAFKYWRIWCFVVDNAIFISYSFIKQLACT